MWGVKENTIQYPRKSDFEMDKICEQYNSRRGMQVTNVFERSMSGLKSILR